MYADLLLSSVNSLAVIELHELANGKLYFDELVKNDRFLWKFSNLQFEEIEKPPSSRMIPTKLEEAALRNEKLTSPLTEKIPSRKVTPQDMHSIYQYTSFILYADFVLCFLINRGLNKKSLNLK